MIRKTNGKYTFVLLLYVLIAVGAGLLMDRGLSWHLSKCDVCKKSGIDEGHRRMCPAGHIYYECQPTQVQQHLSCPRWDDTPSFP